MNQKKTGINAPSKLGGGKIAATPRTRRSLLKTPGSHHKKDDDVDFIKLNDHIKVLKSEALASKIKEGLKSITFCKCNRRCMYTC